MEYSVEKLYNETEVLISPEHRFGTDAMLLSGFCRPRREEQAVDLCSGCGIVALRWHDLGHRGPCKAVELDPRGTALLTEAVNRQQITHIEPVCMDLKKLESHPTAHVVAANPPYFTGGFVSPDAARATARHEGGCTLEQVVDAAWRLLRDGGRFCPFVIGRNICRGCAVSSVPVALSPNESVLQNRVRNRYPGSFCWRPKRAAGPVCDTNLTFLWRMKPEDPAVNCKKYTTKECEVHVRNSLYCGDPHWKSE
ncbi:O-methyltransferase [gut metagenome]|uniref:O-methyltransferase n=1 Tax=gut metagenome TaxID=749906 RepID=J9GNQ9_9ZZZZ